MRVVVYAGPGSVEVADVPDPALETAGGRGLLSRRCDHGVIIRMLATCICGSDLHTLHSAESVPGMTLGHELTGVVEEVGPDVTNVKVGDVCVVPFNVACGTCQSCRSGLTSHCLVTNPSRPGATYGMGVTFGGWAGLQAEYAVVPYADFNLVVLPDPGLVGERLLDVALLGDVGPTGLHAATRAGVQPGSHVYVAGAGPVGLATAVASRMLGAAAVVVGDPNPARADQARAAGFIAVDPSAGPLPDLLEQAIRRREADAAVDCVGESRAGSAILESLVTAVRPGGALSVAGVYPRSPAGSTLGAGAIWSKALTVSAGATPARGYVDGLLTALSGDALPLASALGARAVPLHDAASAYADFAAGMAGKVVLVP